MSDAEEKNDKWAGEEKDLPTASFSGSVAIRSLPVEVMENLKARSRFSREAEGVGDIAPVNTWFDGGYLWM